MATEMQHEVRSMQEKRQGLQDDEHVGCSIGIMAHNEEANIARAIHAVLEQQSPSLRIEEVIVVASGCTDRTIPIVADIALLESRVRLSIQEKREGKASAINLFLKQAISPVVVLIGADVLPSASALEYLCLPLKDPKVGMVGGRPVPVNDPATFMGYAAHLLWRLHDRMARMHPKLGEVIAFRNVIAGIPNDSAVDEISIQALISQLGYQLIYEPACIVYNKGPLSIRDFLRQRRRIYAGHMQARDQQNYQAATMNARLIARHLIACRDFTMSSPRRMMWTLGTVILEGYARLQGYYDYRRRRDHHVWQMVDTTKDLEANKQKIRRICNAQSVLVFRFILENAGEYDVNPERADREATEVARKLLPLLRTRMRKEDKLSINGSGIMTAVIRAEQHGAELVAKRIQEAVQAAPVRIGLRGREVKITLACSILTFALKAESGR
ncbi:MAG TPA: glycosyltransferase [Ktedonobacteraceae bacterium]|nr:glycosyltransferase [Ktedonobacteraceae bacterium]